MISSVLGILGLLIFFGLMGYGIHLAISDWVDKNKDRG
jgi:hypothetical protein